MFQVDHALVNAAVGGVVGFVLREAAGAIGKRLGASAGSEIVRLTPEGLRPAVVAELNALATSAKAGMTVNDAATAILSKISQRFPQAQVADVLPIVADFALAFDAGLAQTPKAA